MPRRAAIIPNRSFHTTVPDDLLAKLDLLLWSDVEQCVPRGAYQTFLCDKIRETLEHRPLDLAPYAGTLSGQYVLHAHPTIIRMLEILLKGTRP